MYVEPNTIVELYKGIDLDKEYKHTYYYASTGERDSFFDTHNKYFTLTKQTYQRAGRGYLKIELEYAQVYDVNYMRFRNSSYEDRWFYAFVEGCEYINNKNTLIRYSIDVMTTWAFDYSLRECFIERAHTRTDNIGEFIQPEPLKLGEYYKNEIPVDTGIYPLMVSLFTNVNPSTFEPIAGQMINGFYSAAAVSDYEYTEAGLLQLNNQLDRIADAGKTDQIVGIEIRSKFIQYTSGIKEIRIAKPTGQEDFGGYIPKNKKLYTFPYNYLQILSPTGKNSLAYEFFAGSSCAFNIICAGTMGDSILCIPLEYMGANMCFEESSAIRSFPPIAYNTNTYKETYARIKATLLTSIIGTVGNAAASIAGAASQAQLTNSLAPASWVGKGSVSKGEMIASDMLAEARNNYAYRQAGLNTASGVMGDLVNMSKQLDIAKLSPINTRNTVGDYTLMYAGGYDFLFSRMNITAEFAEMVDNFFTLYGYTLNKIALPNRRARERWTYIKTVNCEVNNQGVPQEDIELINSIYNRGVTFWVTNALIGDYTQSNNPLGG